MGRWLAWLAAVALASCAPSAEPAHPALWEVTGPHGEHAWLFGTIHALPRPAAWHSPAIDRALGRANRIVVEIAEDPSQSAGQRTFAALAHGAGLPPLSARVAPELRPRLAAALAKAGRSEADFAQVETWAAALTLARADEGDSANGIDRAVVALAGKRPVVGLESTAGQLGLFDTLPEIEQRHLLAAVVNEPAKPEFSPSAAWRKGDMIAIERETRAGMLADPELRAVLFTGRNRAWADKIAAMLAAHQRPFVAVGGAHMAGPEGLPSLLAMQGFVVRRVQ